MLVCKSAMQRKALCIPETPTLSLTVQGYVISRIFGAPNFPSPNIPFREWSSDPGSPL